MIPAEGSSLEMGSWEPSEANTPSSWPMGTQARKAYLGGHQQQPLLGPNGGTRKDYSHCQEEPIHFSFFY